MMVGGVKRTRSACFPRQTPPETSARRLYYGFFVFAVRHGTERLLLLDVACIAAVRLHNPASLFAPERPWNAVALPVVAAACCCLHVSHPPCLEPCHRETTLISEARCHICSSRPPVVCITRIRPCLASPARRPEGHRQPFRSLGRFRVSVASLHGASLVHCDPTWPYPGCSPLVPRVPHTPPLGPDPLGLCALDCHPPPLPAPPVAVPLTLARLWSKRVMRSTAQFDAACKRDDQ